MQTSKHVLGHAGIHADQLSMSANLLTPCVMLGGSLGLYKPQFLLIYKLFVNTHGMVMNVEGENVLVVVPEK